MRWYYRKYLRINGRGNPLAPNQLLSQGLCDAVFDVFVFILNKPFTNKLFCGELNALKLTQRHCYAHPWNNGFISRNNHPTVAIIIYKNNDDNNDNRN